MTEKDNTINPRDCFLPNEFDFKDKNQQREQEGYKSNKQSEDINIDEKVQQFRPICTSVIINLEIIVTSYPRGWNSSGNSRERQKCASKKRQT